MIVLIRQRGPMLLRGLDDGLHSHAAAAIIWPRFS